MCRIDTSRTQRFSKSFFPFCIKAWNELGLEIRNAPTVSAFERLLLSIIRPTRKSFDGITSHSELSIIPRLRVHFSDLHEHRFDHNFASESPLFICDSGIESVTSVFSLKQVPY